MTEKVCTKCGFKKPINQFSWKNKSKGYRHARCKKCAGEDMKASFARNGKHYMEVSYQSMKRRRIEHAMKVYAYLLCHPCVDCGEAEPIVLEFDHVRGQKVKDVTQMVGDCHSWDKIEEEIKKCEVRCANCHRLKTARQPGTTLHRKWQKILVAQNENQEDAVKTLFRPVSFFTLLALLVTLSGKGE